MANKKLHTILKWILTFFVGLAFVFAILFIGLIISQFLQSNEFSFQAILVAVGFIGASVIITKQTHLLGHYFIGLLFHYRLISYNLQGISMIPLQKEKNSAHLIWYYAAGILCNLVLGCLLVLLLWLLPLQSMPLLQFFLFALCITLFAYGGLQSLSYCSDGLPTDGKILWGLLFHSDFSKYYVSTVHLSEALKVGLRPSQLPLQSYKEESEVTSSDAVFLLYLYYKALDLQKASTMLKYVKMLENNFSIIPQHLQATVICELCYASTLKGQTHLAQSYYALMREFPAEDRTLSYYRACAYYFFYGKGNIRQTLSAISYGMETLSACPFSGIAAMEQTLLQNLLQDMQEHLA